MVGIHQWKIPHLNIFNIPLHNSCYINVKKKTKKTNKNHLDKLGLGSIIQDFGGALPGFQFCISIKFQIQKSS